MKITILTDRNSYRQDLREVRNDWVEDILNFLGIETEIFNDESFDHLDKLDYLHQNKIEIIGFPTIEGLQVFSDGELVGEWGGPEFALIEEDGTLYYQITVEHWSILEEEIDIE